MKKANYLLILLITFLIVGLIGLFGLHSIILRALTTLFVKIILPFLLAIFISYLLYPLLTKLTDVLNMHRTSAIVLIFLSFFTIVMIGIYKGLPLFVMELEEISEQLPQIISLYEGFIYSVYDSTINLPEAVRDEFVMLIIKFEAILEGYVNRFLDQLVQSLNYMINYFMIPVLVFYMLKDFKSIQRYLASFVPEKYKVSLEQVIPAIHLALGTYIRGQIVLSFFIFTLAFLLFYLIDVKYAFVLAVIMGIMNVIPYFGPIIGTVPAIIVASATSWQLVIYVIIIAVVIQVIESALLSPYIMGKTARLHPIAIIFILLISGEIGGIIAMIVAIPLVMITRAIMHNLSAQKQQCIDN